MAAQRRATLRSVWWKAMIDRIRHCSICGKPLEKKHVKSEGRRRLVCTGCGEITYVNPKVVAGLIPVMPDGRIALLKRDIEPARGKWTYPAGYQEMGESVADAAARETWEEIVARVKVERMLGVYSYPDAGVVTIVYLGRVKRGERPRAGHETQEARLFRPNEIPWNDLAFRSTTEALEDWLEFTGTPPHRKPPLSKRERVAK